MCQLVHSCASSDKGITVKYCFWENMYGAVCECIRILLLGEGVWCVEWIVRTVFFTVLYNKNNKQLWITTMQ